jgi:hypothetical protein
VELKVTPTWIFKCAASISNLVFPKHLILENRLIEYIYRTAYSLRSKINIDDLAEIYTKLVQNHKHKFLIEGSNYFGRRDCILRKVLGPT